MPTVLPVQLWAKIYQGSDLSALHLTKEQLKKDPRICSAHFKDSDFLDPSNPSKSRLRHDATPFLCIVDASEPSVPSHLGVSVSPQTSTSGISPPASILLLSASSPAPYADAQDLTPRGINSSRDSVLPASFGKISVLLVSNFLEPALIEEHPSETDNVILNRCTCIQRVCGICSLIDHDYSLPSASGQASPDLDQCSVDDLQDCIIQPDVIATCRNPSAADDLQKYLAEAGQPPAVQLDVESDESIFKAAAEVGKLVESVDILINNAGMAGKNHPYDPASSIDRVDALRVYNTNVLGTLKVTEAFLPLLSKGNEKKIINISSDCGSLAKASSEFVLVSYSASKAALNMVTRYQAFELPDFIIVAIEPGWVDTEMGSAGEGWTPNLTPVDCAQIMYRTVSNLQSSDSSWFLYLDGKRFPF